MGTVEEERKAFEDFWSREMNTEIMDLHRCEFPMAPPDFVQPYACHETQRSWLTWLAAKAHADEMNRMPCELWEALSGEWRVLIPGTLNDVPQDRQKFDTESEALNWIKSNGYRVIE